MSNTTNPYLEVQGPGGISGQENLRVTKGFLKFNALTIKRVNSVPSAYEGRVGDIVIIDDTDSPDPTGAGSRPSDRTPKSVGIWIKQPRTYTTSPSGTVVIGYPGRGALAGDILNINGVDVSFSGPYDSASATSTEINGASIPNITASVLGEAVMITNTTNGAITFSNTAGQPMENIGLYSIDSFATNPPDGVWVPVVDVATAGSPSASSVASVLTLFNEPSLPKSRNLNPTVGLKITDNGALSSLDIEHDINSVAAGTEPLIADQDTFLIYNDSTASVEKYDMSQLTKYLGLQSALTVSSPTVTTGATTSIGTIPAGKTVTKVILSITTAYSAGASISIGDSVNPARLMATTDNNPQATGSYIVEPVEPITLDTPMFIYIGGAPATGQSKVFLDYVNG